MKNKTTLVWLSLLAVFLFLAGSANKADNISGKRNRQLQNADTIPAILGPGKISTRDDESGATFSPDGQTCFFVKKTPSTIKSSTYVICFSKFENGNWSEPQLAPFSGRYKDFSPAFSPDGSKLYFISNRPGNEKTTFDTDIWMVEKSGERWTEPVNMGNTVNSKAFELGCSVTRDGTLYFSSTRDNNNVDIYYARQVNGQYTAPVKLDSAVNSPYSETDPFIAPDESYILFTSQGRPDALAGPGAGASYPRSDIYISFRKNGQWTTAKNLGYPVNSDAEESSPSVSGDGKILYFTSERNFVSIPMKRKLTYASLEEQLHTTMNGLGDIYRVPISVFMKNMQ